jgi:hypothetical protein
VLAQRDVDVGGAVARRQLVVGQRTQEQEPLRRHFVAGDHRPQGGVVARHDVVTAGEDEPVVDVDVPLELLAEPEDVLDLLVGSDPADEQDVDQAVAQDRLERRHRGRTGQTVPRRGNREDAGRCEAERCELRAVVLRVAKREIHRADQRRQLLPPEPGQPEEGGVPRRA